MRKKRKQMCYIETGNRTIEHMIQNQLRHAHTSKDNRKQSKTTGFISKDTEVKRWPCVHQVYLVVQHGLGLLKISFPTIDNDTCPRYVHCITHINKQPSVHIVSAYGSAWSQLEQLAMGTFRDKQDVPYISSFISRIAEFLD